MVCLSRSLYLHHLMMSHQKLRAHRIAVVSLRPPDGWTPLSSPLVNDGVFPGVCFLPFAPFPFMFTCFIAGRSETNPYTHHRDWLEQTHIWETGSRGARAFPCLTTVLVVRIFSFRFLRHSLIDRHSGAIRPRSGALSYPLRSTKEYSRSWMSLLSS
jgi:hypothetical protein